MYAGFHEGQMMTGGCHNYTAVCNRFLEKEYLPSMRSPCLRKPAIMFIFVNFVHTEIYVLLVGLDASGFHKKIGLFKTLLGFYRGDKNFGAKELRLSLDTYIYINIIFSPFILNSFPCPFNL